VAEHQDAIARIKALCLELRLALEDLDDSPLPPPINNITPITAGEVELTGIIGRPQLREVKGKQLWTAGLGIKDGMTTYWRAITAWGHIAVEANAHQRGACVTIIAKPKTERYVGNDGTLQSKTSYTISRIMSAAVSSATTG